MCPNVDSANDNAAALLQDDVSSVVDGGGVGGVGGVGGAVRTNGRRGGLANCMRSCSIHAGSPLDIATPALPRNELELSLIKLSLLCDEVNLPLMKST